MLATLEDEILIACSRLHFDQVHRDRVARARERGEIDWELVYSAAVAHQVAPLVYKNLECCGSVNDLIPRIVRDEFQKLSRGHTLKNAIVAQGIGELAAFFASRSHDVLLLKRAAFSVSLREVYDTTMSDDVDIVVKPRGEPLDQAHERYIWKLRPWMFADRLQKLFKGLNCADTDRTSAVIHEFAALDHPWRSISGLELENRIHHDVLWGGVVTIDFRKIWHDAIEAQIDGTPLHVPHVCDLLIMSAVSIHRKPFVRLRNLLEIHELGQGMNDDEWERLTSKARDYECSGLVFSALLATKTVLGSDIPEATLDALRPSVVIRRALAFVNRHIGPTKIARSRNPSADVSTPHRNPWERARRFLPLTSRQLMRFVWYRIVLYRIFRIIKW
jgi:hypothetical protein